MNTGILLFDGAEELDFVGPWEVFSAAVATLHPEDCVISIAEHVRPLRAARGLLVTAQCSLADAPPLDVLVVPGGRGARTEVHNTALMAWIRGVGPRCRWVTSVCTGVLLLHEAGLARGKRVTTHWSFVEDLRRRGDVTVVEGARYVRDGNLLTAAGVSAGIDMALWLLGEMHGIETARHVQRYIEYFPEPPYPDQKSGSRGDHTG